MTVVAETRILPEALDVTWEKIHGGFDQATSVPQDAST
jgi:hypothetical protein